MMYLRTGWVVGNVGLSKAILLIGLAKLVTITTGLSTSSLATNVKMGAGGFYNLLSRSLGPEIGSAVGIPLYLSQALSCALYVAGFTEGWFLLFPAHDPLIVSTVIFAIILILSMIDSKIAIRTQYFTILIIIASLVSLLLGPTNDPIAIESTLVTEKMSFWAVFAIFFPAVTGITAGASMSGNLKNPKKSIPIGTLSAIGVTTVIYISLAIWLSENASMTDLLNDNTIMMTIAKWPTVVILGLLGATASSALGSILGAPRTLSALAKDKLIPFHKIFSKDSKNGEPRYAIFLTAIIIEVSIVLGDLNTIAPLLTMFFLITYCSINIVVAIEKGLGIPSFRPSINIPLFIPIIGALWCLVTMFLVDPVFSLIAIIFILFTYVLQLKRQIKSNWSDIRSALFNSIAEWSAKTSAKLPYSARAWKPNLLIPVEDPSNWSYLLSFINSIAFPSGSVRLFTVKKIDKEKKSVGFAKMLAGFLSLDVDITSTNNNTDKIRSDLDEYVDYFSKERLFANSTIINADNFLEGISITTQALSGSYFPPNLIFFTMSKDPAKDDDLKAMIGISIREELGIMILSHKSNINFGNQQTINLWLRRGTPNLNLSILMAIQLQRNWDNVKINLISVSKDDKHKAITQNYLGAVIDHARIRGNVSSNVLIGNFNDAIKDAPRADLNILGLSNDIDCDSMHNIVSEINTACLFIRDSGKEKALL